MSLVPPFIIKHKFISVIVFLVILGGGYQIYKKATKAPEVTRYVTAQAIKSTIISSVSGSGQVSSSNQVDIKSKVSGDIAMLSIHNGQEVKAGAIVARLDARDAQKTVRDAEANLASAKLSLEKLLQPVDRLSVIQAENALAQAREAKQNAEANLTKAYDDAFNYISNTFLDIPSVMQGLDGILYGETVGNKGQENINAYADSVKEYDETVFSYRDDVIARYRAARTAYDSNSDHYKSVTRDADRVIIESLLTETYQTTRAISEAVKGTNNYLNFVQDIIIEKKLKTSTLTTTYLSDLDGFTSQVNGHLLNLLNVQNAIKTSKDTIVNSDRSIIEKTESLKKLKGGADPLDVESTKLTIQQRQNALTDAQEKLADYTIRAPFTGTIAAVNVKASDTVSSGTVVATLIAQQKIAEISLNEVDIAKLSVGQKATLVFDAIDHLQITSEVAEIDAIGAVSQGVVSYNVKLRFDTQDDRVKPGMSVSAAIVIDIKQDVLAVPNSAIKTQGPVGGRLGDAQGTHYVEILDQIGSQGVNPQGVASPTPPRQQQVEIGIANDTFTEILSGLSEGDYVVTRTIAPSSSQTQATAPSLFPAGGGNRSFGGGGGTGAVRIQGR